MGNWITGQNWSNLEKISSSCGRFLASGWNKYLDSGQSKHSHTVEVVCTTVPQILNKHKVLRWKKTKWRDKKSCKSHSRSLDIVKLRKIKKDFCKVTSACEDEQLTTHKLIVCLIELPSISMLWYFLAPE